MKHTNDTKGFRPELQRLAAKRRKRFDGQRGSQGAYWRAENLRLHP